MNSECQILSMEKWRTRNELGTRKEKHVILPHLSIHYVFG